MSSIDTTPAVAPSNTDSDLSDAARFIRKAEEIHAAVDPRIPDYRAAFKLARALRGVSADPTPLAPAAAHFCVLQGRDFDNFYGGYFLRAFALVRFPGDTNPLALAWIVGEVTPYPCRDLTPKYKRFVSMCYLLSRGNPGRTFFVARTQLEQLSGLKSNTVTQFLRFMCDERLIVCVSDDYTFHPRKGDLAKSKEYKFVGPDLPPAPSDEPDAPAGWPLYLDDVVYPDESDPTSAPVALDVAPEPDQVVRDQLVAEKPAHVVEPTPAPEYEDDPRDGDPWPFGDDEPSPPPPAPIATPRNPSEKWEEVRRRAETLARTPTFLRRFEDNLSNLEDKAVSAVLQLTKLGTIQEVRAEGAKSREGNLARFDDFHRIHRDFPVRLSVGRYVFHYDDVATNLLNDVTSSSMYSAWIDLRSRYPHEKRLGVIFPWSRVKTGVRGCGSFCVLHNHHSDVAQRDRSFRISFALKSGLLLHLEPLPAFVASLAVSAACPPVPEPAPAAAPVGPAPAGPESWSLDRDDVMPADESAPEPVFPDDAPESGSVRKPMRPAWFVAARAALSS
ncbi:MAG: hypothetical protein P4L85_07730 [Paludisphaera borealis]|uniref:hypothetical protein n=1 Tax=Paludisphaera borealis TaxID=1387353 RepID=UPI002848E70A|nr:hypothetical protein [Paludisphaera borealis]MDR3619223.1 hypothetical protein [Paludisphaera borealis]